MARTACACVPACALQARTSPSHAWRTGLGVSLGSHCDSGCDHLGLTQAAELVMEEAKKGGGLLLTFQKEAAERERGVASAEAEVARLSTLKGKDSKERLKSERKRLETLQAGRRAVAAMGGRPADDAAGGGRISVAICGRSVSEQRRVFANELVGSLSAAAAEHHAEMHVSRAKLRELKPYIEKLQAAESPLLLTAHYSPLTTYHLPLAAYL